MESVGVNKNFWRNKKVLMTGHTGFKGSWLALWLQELGAQLSGFALAPGNARNLFNVADVASEMRSEIGDITNAALVSQFFQSEQPEIVIHMAAQSLVRYSYQHPQETYATNVLGTVNVLEAVRHTASVKAVIIVTSDKCYDNKTTQKHFQEQDALGGHDPYGSSKACAELVTEAYRRSYFADGAVGIASVRAGNVIGGGDWATDRLIPDIINAYLTDSALTVRYPDAVRPWQYVLEPLRGYLLLAEKLVKDPVQYSEAWNFGPQLDDLHSVKSVIAGMNKLWEKELVIDTLAKSLPEASFLGLDSSKALTKLNWSPSWNWATTLQETVLWYKAFATGQDMAVYSREQIKLYAREAIPA
jgi:CDP-glucose 4,6-dehydratase